MQVPARPDFLASVRAMTRAMAVLADASLDDVEELQIAVDEAGILLLPLVDETAGSCLTAEFEVSPGHLSVVLSAPCRPGATVDRTGLPWAMLSAIQPEVDVQSVEGAVAIAIGRGREGASR